MTSESPPIARMLPRSVPLLPPRVHAAGVVVLVVIAACALRVVDPATALSGVPCVFHALTGLHCPGCGTGRGLHALANGDLVGALGMNPLMVLSLPFFAYPFLSNLSLAVRGRRLPALRLPGWWGWAVFGVIAAYWVLRNIPVYPFTLLAP